MSPLEALTDPYEGILYSGEGRSLLVRGGANPAHRCGCLDSGAAGKLFHYLFTGEGQKGDTEFVRGNRAIRDHLVTEKELRLFEWVRPGWYR